MHSILECAHFIILARDTCPHYTIEGACKIYQQITSLYAFLHLHLQFGVQPRGITIPSPYVFIVLSASCTHVQQNLKNPQNDVGILPTLHPHAPK